MQVQDVLSKKSGPVDVSELVKKLRVNKTTVYRQLKKLIQKGLIQEIDFGDGKKRYETLKERHHHHLVCNSCGKVSDVEEILPTNTEKKIYKEQGFKVTRHTVEFFGFCKGCQ